MDKEFVQKADIFVSADVLRPRKEQSVITCCLGYHAWSCRGVCGALAFLLGGVFVRFGNRLYRQVVGIPMGADCAPLVADLFLFCCERDFMMSLSDDNQAGVVDAFDTTSSYLDDILGISGVCFGSLVGRICPSGLQLNKANTSDSEAAFFDLRLSISNDIVSTKICDKRDDFDFEIVIFPGFFMMVFLALHPVGSGSLNSFVLLEHLAMLLTSTLAVLLKQGYRYRWLYKSFSKFCGGCCVWFLSSRLGLSLSCARVFWSLISVVAWCVN